MKKNLLTLGLFGTFMLALSVPCFAEETKENDFPPPPPPPCKCEKFGGEHRHPHFDKQEHLKRKMEFEKRLNLTDEQKTKAKELREQNMKAFEEILTPKQLKELKKMKKEGRKKFDKEHKKRAKCNCEENKMPMFPPKDFNEPKPEQATE